MRLRISALVVAILFCPALAIPPAHASDPNDNSVTVSGTIWIDENVDGIRPPSEPGVPDFRPSILIDGFFGNAPLTDDQGHFTFEVRPWSGRGSLRPGAYVHLSAYYLRPGDETVFKTSAGTEYTHYGCGSVSVKPGDTERTVHIRMVHHPNDGSIPPLDWPLADGHFFKQKHPFRRGCDAGFSVTNADGIPFWDTWQQLGLENAGYPTSGRFVWRDYVIQVFQKVALQWRPNRGIFRLEDYGNPLAIRTEGAVIQWEEEAPWGKAGYVKILIKGKMGKDGAWLADVPHYRCKPGYSISNAGGIPFLDTWMQLGLENAGYPTTSRFVWRDYVMQVFQKVTFQWRRNRGIFRVEDYGNPLANRTQEGVIQWKEEVPWSKAGYLKILIKGEMGTDGAWLVEVPHDELIPVPPGFPPCRRAL